MKHLPPLQLPEPIKLICLLPAFCLFAVSCQNTVKKEEEKVREETAKLPKRQTEIFVSDAYHHRSEGYDWTAVTVTSLNEKRVKIKIRSRADKKKPTCTFDAVAQKIDDHTYQSYIRDVVILYTVDHDKLTIAADTPEHGDALYFYCSGGATFAGEYTRIEGELDSAQADKTLFTSILELQGIGFNISSAVLDGKRTLTIFPYGLEIDNRSITQEITAEVYDAEIEDLNADGSPEVLVYTQSEDDRSSGMVYAFSVNNGKSLSMVYFPPLTENDSLSGGYEGNDEFAIVETSLVQRFPVYEGTKPPGKIRQIVYKLKEGEAMRRFVPSSVTEFDMNKSVYE